MIYLMQTSKTKVIGSFDTIDLSKKYLTSVGVTEQSDFTYLIRIEDMNYISRVCFVNDLCVYNNYDFWTTSAYDVRDNYSNYVVKDSVGNTITEDRFNIEINANNLAMQMVYSVADQVTFNMRVGIGFISLFREECIISGLRDETGLSIASAVSPVIPLIQTGALYEACQVLSTLETNTFLTAERIKKYIDMLTAADIIDYSK